MGNPEIAPHELIFDKDAMRLNGRWMVLANNDVGAYGYL